MRQRTPRRIHNGGSRAASGGGAAETRKNTGDERTPRRIHNGDSRAASGGGAAETRKITGVVGPLNIFYLPPMECILGPICGIAFLRGSLKCVVEARSPQLVGLRSVVNSDGVV